MAREADRIKEPGVPDSLGMEGDEGGAVSASGETGVRPGFSSV